jgi:hypothetical protein
LSASTRTSMVSYDMKNLLGVMGVATGGGRTNEYTQAGPG